MIVTVTESVEGVAVAGTGVAITVYEGRVVAGGGGAVDSVNGQTGVVVLDATDVGADATGTAAAAVTAHEGAANPHPGYLTQAEGDALYHPLTTDVATQAELDAHTTDATAAHAASAVAFTPAGGLAATDVQAALAELDTEKAPTGHTHAGTKTINDQTGTSYTLALADANADGWLRLNNAAAITLTVPPNSSVAFPVGAYVEGSQAGAGQVTITPGAGVTINATPGLKVAAQYGTFGLLKVATDAWLAFGRLSA